MAPDVNSLPASPRADRPRPARTPSDTASRRTSTQMPPPPPPASAFSHRSPTLSSNEQAGVPLRHPRPLTAAELYLECEKEQEAVVNRLTRELTALRAQTASVASNASHSSTSTSASLLPIDISDPNPAHQLTGATHPTPSRRHRSSSSLSTRSIPNTPSTSTFIAGSGVSNLSTQTQTGSNTSSSVPIGGISQASFDRAAAARNPGTGPGNLSRQPSITHSGTSTPARQSLDIPRTHHTQPTTSSYTLPHRPSLSRDPSTVSQTSSTAAVAGTPLPPHSPTQVLTSQHYVDTAAYRNEMEAVKAENESLRQRVRALERALQARRRDSSTSDASSRPAELVGGGGVGVGRNRDSVGGVAGAATSPVVTMAATSPEPRAGAGTIGMGAASVAAWDGGVGGVAPPRERSESQSTTASSRRGMVVGEDEVRVGESAGSVGVGRGV